MKNRQKVMWAEIAARPILTAVDTLSKAERLKIHEAIATYVYSPDKPTPNLDALVAIGKASWGLIARLADLKTSNVQRFKKGGRYE